MRKKPMGLKLKRVMLTALFALGLLMISLFSVASSSYQPGAPDYAPGASYVVARPKAGHIPQPQLPLPEVTMAAE